MGRHGVLAKAIFSLFLSPAEHQQTDRGTGCCRAQKGHPGRNIPSLPCKRGRTPVASPSRSRLGPGTPRLGYDSSSDVGALRDDNELLIPCVQRFISKASRCRSGRFGVSKGIIAVEARAHAHNNERGDPGPAIIWRRPRAGPINKLSY